MGRQCILQRESVFKLIKEEFFIKILWPQEAGCSGCVVLSLAGCIIEWLEFSIYVDAAAVYSVGRFSGGLC